jgi:hypothetical protein
MLADLAAKTIALHPALPPGPAPPKRRARAGFRRSGACAAMPFNPAARSIALHAALLQRCA